MKDRNGVEFVVGQKVRALKEVTEGGEGHDGDPAAKFPEANYIHAREGELGEIEGIDDDYPTVRFEPSGTATLVGSGEIEVVE